MPRPGFCTPHSLRTSHDVVMDVVAILIGVLMFTILLGLIYGIERI
jgi:hypothetical protein